MESNYHFCEETFPSYPKRLACIVDSLHLTMNLIFLERIDLTEKRNQGGIKSMNSYLFLIILETMIQMFQL